MQTDKVNTAPQASFPSPSHEFQQHHRVVGEFPNRKAAPEISYAGIICAAVILDTCAIVCAALLAMPLITPLASAEVFFYEKIVLLTALITGITLALSGSYQPRKLVYSGMAVPSLLLHTVLASSIAAGMAYLFGHIHSYNLAWHSIWVLLSLLLISGFRTILSLVALHTPQLRAGLRTVIIGGGENGERLARFLNRKKDHSLHCIGYVDDRITRQSAGMPSIPFLGPISNIFNLIREGLVDQVIVALPWSADTRTLEILHRLSEYPVHVRLAPDLICYHLPAHVMSNATGVPLMHLLDRPISGLSQIVKRAEDIVLSLLSLAFLAIPMLALAIAIRIDTPGPILFRQRRIGFNNLEFEVLKFRTMHHQYSEHRIRHQAVANDARITRVGFWLRRLSLDELPQIFNVLRGDMSFVGPRPHAPGTQAAGRPFENVVSRYAARHRVKPGITGLAQVRGYRGLTETEDKIIRRVECDIEYIEGWSLLLDMTILLRTVFTVLRMKNAW